MKKKRNNDYDKTLSIITIMIAAYIVFIVGYVVTKTCMPS